MSKFYFIGIKGAGMSALAQLLHDQQHDIKGCDYKEDYYTTEGLKKRKIPIEEFSDVKLTRDWIIIVGNAFVNHPLVKDLKEKDFTLFTYSEYLGKLSKESQSIAITGTHGKTTTTNMIRQLLAPLETINFLVGDGHGSGNHLSDIFVFEACEYKRHFLNYFPKVAVLTNLDFDHPDYYESLADVKRAFNSFIDQSQFVIYNGDDEHLTSIMENKNKKLSFGLNPHNDFYATNIINDDEKTTFDVYCKGRFFDRVKIPVFGTHNVYNALASIAVALYMGVRKRDINQALKRYEGSKRRFELFESENQTIISDYAHHPTEIKATYEALRWKYGQQQLVCIFEPHTYSRTKQFVESFKEALELFDEVYLTSIFTSVRETEATITIEDLAQLIENGKVLNDFEELVPYKDAILVFMGAGDIDKMANQYFQFINDKKV